MIDDQIANWEQRARDKSRERSILDGLIPTAVAAPTPEASPLARAVAVTQRRDGHLLGAARWLAAQPAG